MGANELIQANNPQHGLTSCPTFRDWPVQRNRAAAQDDSEPFADRMNRLAAQLREQQAEGAGWTPRMRRISRRWGSGSA